MALVRNLVARAMVHNNEAQELLAVEASPQAASEGPELAPLPQTSGPSERPAELPLPISKEASE